MGKPTVGTPKEILLNSMKAIILIRLFYNHEFLQLAVLKKDANLGYTRYILHQYSKILSKKIQNGS